MLTYFALSVILLVHGKNSLEYLTFWNVYTWLFHFINLVYIPNSRYWYSRDGIVVVSLGVLLSFVIHSN